ncbi:cytochrome P450 [Micromonospora sp. NPDC049801]|uniref:cytochrome P450 n=1 Tax=unclassified Micromonospora TaxID=2617518 RepID=UPI0033E7C7EE
MTQSFPDLRDANLFRTNAPEAMFAQLRKEQPVYWNDGGSEEGFWNLSRYADVSACYRDHDWLSSLSGAIMGSSFHSDQDSARSKMLVASDLPEHRNFRRVFLGALGPAMAQRIRQQLQALLDRELGILLADGGGDFARSISRQLPVAALMTLLGIDESAANHVVDLTDAVVGYRDETLSDLSVPEETRRAVAQIELLGFLDEILEERHATQPRDDALSHFLAAERTGTLTRDEVIYNLVNLVFGGNETSAHTASGSLLLMMQEPWSYTALVENPDLVPNALTEMLRLTSVAAYVKRVATSDRTMHGTTIKAGQTVLLWIYSANRDPSEFENPLELRLDRKATNHLAFGVGIHRCVGATPALVELETLLHAVAALKDVRLIPDGEPVRLQSNFIRGFTSLPVRVK